MRRANFGIAYRQVFLLLRSVKAQGRLRMRQFVLSNCRWSFQFASTSAKRPLPTILEGYRARPSQVSTWQSRLIRTT